VCAKLRRALGTRKVGHAGTLDPRATGLLIVCAGAATKAVDLFQAQEKAYEGTLRLGATTPSLDAETEVSATAAWRGISDADLAAAAAALTGPLDQTPPMYSAVSVGGQRLYKAARRGEVVARPPRRVTVASFDVARLPVAEGDADAAADDDGDGRPGPHGGRDVAFSVVCSKGTYIRVLAADLGAALGSAAYLTSLRRTRVGTARVEDAWPLEELVATATAGREAREAAAAAAAAEGESA
jgi:tRNA pseudouridine55 synthase